MKYMASRRKKPVWVLYVLGLVAVVMAGVALFMSLNGKLDGSGQGNEPNPPGQTEPDGKTPDGKTPDGKAPDGSTDPSGQTPNTPPERDLDAERKVLMAEAARLAASYGYEEAAQLLGSDPELKNTETESKAADYRLMKETLVPYEGQLYHVFFHSLIIDTAKAFDGDRMANGYNEYMTTVYEFEKMLPLFLEAGYILYDITEMVQFVDGVAQPKPIYLPTGKKPLVISIDDVCYYEYMKTDGFADRLDVDEEGNVVTVVKDKNGNDTVTYDGDVMPILDRFVREHPEFSFKGAKGVVAVTGYEGVFGYRITDADKYDAATFKQMQDKVVEVGNALRATGWRVACHSYTHNQYWTNKTITREQFDHYEKRWMEEVAPYIGECTIFISPNGAYLGDDHWATKRLVESGFTIYCPVGSGMFTSYQDGFMKQDRLNLDGINMIRYPERVKKYFFDPAKVLDPARPPLQ